IDAACRLFAILQNVLMARTIEPGTMPVLDALQPEALAEKLHPQLGALQKLKDPGLDPEQQQNSLAAFQELHAGLPTDVARDVAARAKAVVSNEMDYVRSGLRNIYGVAPSAVHELAASVRTTLDRTRSPDPNWKPLIRWADLRTIRDKL